MVCVVTVHRLLTPMALGLTKVLARLKVRLCPVVLVMALLATNWKEVKLLLVMAEVQLPEHEAPELLKLTSDGN